MEWYKKNNMTTFGGGLNAEDAQKPAIITLKDGKKIGFVGFNEYCPLAECYTQGYKMGAVPYSDERAKKAIDDLKEKVDYVIVSVQFGEVDSYAPSATQAKITRKIIDMGADMVYGSQAHQVQQIEFYKGKPIFHGLGNFLFDQTHRIGVRQAYFLHNYIFDGKVVQSVPVFTMEALEIRPYIATPEETEAMKKVVYKDELIYKW